MVSALAGRDRTEQAGPTSTTSATYQEITTIENAVPGTRPPSSSENSSSTTFAVTSTTETTLQEFDIPSFGSGTKLVNNDIEPGRYIAKDVSLCYWARLKGLSGSLDEVIANGNETGSQVIVDILPSDVAFESTRCGRWVAYLPPGSPVTSFSDGTYAVGSDIEPGRYRSQGASSICYWERTSDFSGVLSSILANDISEGDTVVDIRGTDVGFTARGCGVWSKIG